MVEWEHATLYSTLRCSLLRCATVLQYFSEMCFVSRNGILHEASWLAGFALYLKGSSTVERTTVVRWALYDYSSTLLKMARPLIFIYYYY